ncbi:MAG: hypothetical protein AB8B63_08145 [Granulosicoccus sp.]
MPTARLQESVWILVFSVVPQAFYPPYRDMIALDNALCAFFFSDYFIGYQAPGYISERAAVPSTNKV